MSSWFERRYSSRVEPDGDGPPASEAPASKPPVEAAATPPSPTAPSQPPDEAAGDVLPTAPETADPNAPLVDPSTLAREVLERIYARYQAAISEAVEGNETGPGPEPRR